MNIDEHILGSGLWKAPERDLNSVLLDLNENQFLRQFLARFIATELQPQDLFTYPNYQPLLSELANYCKVPTQHVLLTNGADQAIDLLLRLLFSPGDRVVIPSPVFSFYYQMLDINGVTPVVVGFEKQAQGFVLPIPAVLDALSTSQGLILCNPNNPLGGAWRRSNWRYWWRRASGRTSRSLLTSVISNTCSNLAWIRSAGSDSCSSSVRSPSISDLPDCALGMWSRILIRCASC